MQPRSLSDEQLQTLAKEIRDGIVGIETDWLEWKSALDLNIAEARFGLSKPILGMANRDPGLPGRNRGGYGYVLVGVEPGAMPGTDQFDPAKLHDWIDPYIGATGPAWRPRYIQVDDTTILAIEVDPPRDGDSIHTLKKTYDRFEAGRIFVRKNGKTHPAEPEDIKNLEQRAQGSRLSLDLGFVGDLAISWFDEAALIATITEIADSQKEALLSQAQEPDRAAKAQAEASQLLTAGFYVPDTRTISQYTEEVNQWHSEWTEQAPEHWVSAYADAGHGTCSLSLTNLTDRNFTSVEVRLEIPDAPAFTNLYDLERDIPKKPLPYGQGNLSLGFDTGLSTLLPILPLADTPTISADNYEDRAVVVWEVGDVRPEQTLNSDDLYVIVGKAPSTRRLSVSWSATSKSASGVERGTTELPLTDKPVTFNSIEHDLNLS